MLISTCDLLPEHFRSAEVSIYLREMVEFSSMMSFAICKRRSVRGLEKGDAALSILSSGGKLSAAAHAVV